MSYNEAFPPFFDTTYRAPATECQTLPFSLNEFKYRNFKTGIDFRINDDLSSPTSWKLSTLILTSAIEYDPQDVLLLSPTGK